MNLPLFIHIPRTGGTSLKEYSSLFNVPKTAKHATFRQLQAMESELVAHSSTVFTIVRHPYSWRYSWWRYLRIPGCNSGLSFEQEMCLKQSFPEHIAWLPELIESGRATATNYGTETRLFIQDQAAYIDGVGAPEILRFESLRNDCQRLIGIDFTAWENGSGPRDEWKAHVDKKCKQIIREIHALDFAVFDF